MRASERRKSRTHSSPDPADLPLARCLSGVRNEWRRLKSRVSSGAINPFREAYRGRACCVRAAHFAAGRVATGSNRHLHASFVMRLDYRRAEYVRIESSSDAPVSPAGAQVRHHGAFPCSLS